MICFLLSHNFTYYSEISKNEDLLKEYQLYKKFLDSLTPTEWKEEKRNEKYGDKEPEKPAADDDKQSVASSSKRKGR